MNEDEKQKLARIEKYAQAHLDRVHTVTSGATKAALAWSVALAIIWWQQLEPKFAQIQVAQASRRALLPATTLGPQLVGLNERFAKDDDLAKQEQLELPFSIKIKLPPQLVSTLWLLLAFGLSWYLFDTRKRVLRLAARGLRLLTEVKAEPPDVRSVVGEAVWWLAPLPANRGQVVTTDEFRRGLGWQHKRFPFEAVVLIVWAVLIIGAETRVLYVAFCIESFLTGLTNPASWLSLTLANWLLFLATILTIWRWFIPAAVPDILSADKRASKSRRDLLSTVWRGGALAAVALLWFAMTTYAFAAVHRSRKPGGAHQHYAKARSRRRKKPGALQLPSEGWYVNIHTGTVHAATSRCKTCLIATHPGRLTLVSADTVQWNERGRSEISPSITLALHAFSVGHESGPGTQERISGNRSTPEVGWHPHGAHRTFMIEQHALELLKKKQGAERACQVLLQAVQATPVFGLKTGMRLYDLLAGLTVRFHRTEDRSALVRVLRDELSLMQSFERKIEQPGVGIVLSWLYRLSNNEQRAEPATIIKPVRKHEHHKTSTSVPYKGLAHAHLGHNDYLKAVVEDRITKWQNQKSGWYQRWSDTKKPVKWAGGEIP
jgi:hypothetical protein